MKDWKAGKADEAWKVLICGRDLNRFDDAIGTLGTIFFEFSELSKEVDSKNAIMEKLSTMSGSEIVKQLKKYENVLVKCIENGLSKEQ